MPSLYLKEDLVEEETSTQNIPEHLRDHNYFNKNVSATELCFSKNVSPESPESLLTVDQEVTSASIDDSNITSKTVNYDRELDIEQNEASLQIEEEEGIQESASANDEVIKEKQNFSFSDLKNDINSVYVPISWIRHEITESSTGEPVIFFSHTSVRCIGGNLKTVSVKELIVKSDLTFVINVMGRRLNLNNIGINEDKIPDTNSLNEILQLLNTYNVCTGCESSAPIYSSVADIDCAGNLRHKFCPLLLSNGTMCNRCRNVQKSVNKNSTIDSGVNNKARLKWNSSNMNYIRRRYQNVRQNVQRAKLQIKQL